MTGLVGVCTDSGSQLPARLATGLGIEVVPLTVTVGEREFLEGVDLDVDELYDLLDDAANDLTTAQPSPGQCAAAYEDLAARGCSSIIAVHSSLSECNTLNAARLATRSSAVPVRIIDCGSISFGVGYCAWAAAEAAAGGASVDEIVGLIEGLRVQLGHVFTTGRSADEPDAGIEVATGIGEAVTSLVTAPDTPAAVAAMAGYVLSRPGRLRIGVGAGAREALPLADELELALRSAEREIELVRYRIGAGLAQRMRPGTVGCFFVPIG
ncbi:MAG: DegV family protein [Ilumatobacteraceae bacterium]